MPNIDPIFTTHAQSLPWLRERTIFLTVHGSRAYNTSLPSSDTDYKGIAIPPIEYFTGFTHRFEQAECKEPDAVVFEVRKFFALARDVNPNVIEMLYTDPEDHVIVTPAGRLLLDNRDLFLSRKTRHTFAGYASAQMKRINVHHKWLVNPLKSPPNRGDFGLRPENEMTPQQRDNLGAAMAMVDREVATWHDLQWTDLDEPQRIALRNRMTEYLSRMSVDNTQVYLNTARNLGMDDNLIDVLRREKDYRAAKQQWDSYQTWLKTRNPARAELESKWGLDTKHALHLVRLTKMCREILTTGKVIVKRPDRDELLAIRNGAWTYEELVEWFAKQDAEMDEIYKNSVLPHSPNQAKLDALCVEMVNTFNNTPCATCGGTQKAW